METLANGISENSSIEILNVSKNLVDCDYFGETFKQLILLNDLFLLIILETNT